MSARSSSLKIIIAGYIVGGPLGGLVWHHLQYILGLHKMGHKVLFVEDSDDYPSCYNPQTNQFSSDPTYGLAFINKVFSQYGLQDRWAYHQQQGNIWHGVNEKKINDFISNTDIFLNLSGMNPLHEKFLKIPVRVLLDTDPVFTQIKHLTDTAAFDRARLHNRFFSFGENFGKENCAIPDDGFDWKPTRQPVYIDAWNFTAGNKNAKWTTVMQWDSYKVREYKGQVFGMKSVSFEEYYSLPGKSSESFELAIGGSSTPKEKLSAAGWSLCDPLAVSLDPTIYQQFIQHSKGEWSVAKHGYVSGHTGWFSERSTGYLSSGRPVVVQDTGFSDFIETGRGLFSFTSPEDSLAALEEIDRNYSAHCRFAREISEEYFRYDKVLNALIQRCNISAPIN